MRKATMTMTMIILESCCITGTQFRGCSSIMTFQDMLRHVVGCVLIIETHGLAMRHGACCHRALAGVAIILLEDGAGPCQGALRCHNGCKQRGFHERVFNGWSSLCCWWHAGLARLLHALAFSSRHGVSWKGLLQEHRRVGRLSFMSQKLRQGRGIEEHGVRVSQHAP